MKLEKREKMSHVKIRKNKGKLDLVLDPIIDLPFVSILTITKDRLHFFLPPSLPIHNFNSFSYPRERIEWIIIDDSKTDELKNYLPNNPSIKYFFLPTALPIADKRNYGVKRCNGEIIVHMDDDDFYFSDSVLAKVRVLQTYKKECVYSLPLGIHDIIHNKSAVADSKDKDIPEASLAYTKTFWRNGKFKTEGKNSEWYGLCYGRMDKTICMPFIFNMIAFSHTTNVTGKLRRLPKSGRRGQNFSSILKDEVMHIVNHLRNFFIRKEKNEIK